MTVSSQRFQSPTIPGRFSDGINWYVYCGNNPLNRVDDNGKFLRIVSNPLGGGYKILSPEANREIVCSNLSMMAGCAINIDKNGDISMGAIYRQGPQWDSIRSRLELIIQSSQVIGITTNPPSLTGWGFNPVYKNDPTSLISWASLNGNLSAYIQVTSQILGQYKHENPDFSFFSYLFENAKKYIYGDQSLGGATAHEVIGHAYDFVSGGEYYNEYSALRGENMYHDATGDYSRDVYP